jgi:hypothetical protein
MDARAGGTHVGYRICFCFTQAHLRGSGLYRSGLN